MIVRRLAKFIVGLTLVALIGLGCVYFDLLLRSPSKPFGPAPTSTPPSLADILPALANLPAEAQIIEITDNWDGFYELAPLRASFSMKLVGAQFTGQAQFAADARDAPGESRTATADIAAPQEVVRQAITILLEARASEGTYVPTPICCDDYPRESIRVSVGQTALRFTRESAEYRWGAFAEGRQFIVTSDAPDRMIKLLNPYLARDVEEKVFGRKTWIY